MAEDIYEELGEGTPSVELKQRHDLKKIYYDFLSDFKNYLVEFVKESSVDLAVSALEVGTEPQKLFDGEVEGVSVVLKNQGDVACFVSTDRRGAYRLDPWEKERFWLNAQTTVVTLSGSTTLGYIRG